MLAKFNMYSVKYALVLSFWLVDKIRTTVISIFVQNPSSKKKLNE